MRVINGHDVNELYWLGMRLLQSEGRDESSRNGPVRVFPEPVTSVYENPRQRVLLDGDRKANPFFHLFESLWMLAGRNDVAALNTYITDFGTRFAEEDGLVHGAYGHRWRQAFGYDQLRCIVHQLKHNPSSRQAVLQMWDGRIPRHNSPGENDLLGTWKDRPCNTHVYFRVHGQWPVLDMLVSCRSNDIVYGAYGANAVHFSVLHEYMAGRIGAIMGRMHQMSFNYHAYHDVLEKVPMPSKLHTYAECGIQSIPMGHVWDEWDADLEKWFLWHRNMLERGEIAIRSDYVNSWFPHTASPMFIAHWKWKQAMQHEAREWASKIDASDWRLACSTWMNQRTEARSR